MRKSKDIDLDELFHEDMEVEEQIRRFTEIIENAPAQAAEQKRLENSVMPPPDGLNDRMREIRYFANLKADRLDNAPRHKSGHIPMRIILILAILALIWWIYRALTEAGVA